ncbi:MAG: cysteine desulfurase [Acidobacteriota bacterium]
MTATTLSTSGLSPSKIPPFDAEAVRRDFPFLTEGRDPAGAPPVFLDSAASAQKPRPVLDAMTAFYEGSYANIHRGLYDLAARADAAYDGAREKVRAFIGAERTEEVVFVRGTTEGINLVAQSFLAPRLAVDDEVIVSELEHHSNLVPWQQVCRRAGASLKVAPIGDDGALDLDALEGLIGSRTRLIAITHLSNAIGTVVPISKVTALARHHGVPVLVDGAQAVPHGPVNIQELGCDFYVFSGHKMFGPTGIGVLWGRYERLAAMEPYQSGGGMIQYVTFDKAEFEDPPSRFEAGTPNIAGAVGLGAAVDYLGSLDWRALAAHEKDLLTYAEERLREVPGLELIPAGSEQQAVLSFVMEGAHAHDVGTVLASRGVAVRAGHHCAQPLMRRLGVPATTRASFALYNCRQDVDALAEGLRTVRQLFAP